MPIQKYIQRKRKYERVSLPKTKGGCQIFMGKRVEGKDQCRQFFYERMTCARDYEVNSHMVT
uniref:Putative ovule protein n=1 Tax=Solanum chacoense TaxID=4108 RepID=A0A0V0GES2_SOLCH